MKRLLIFTLFCLFSCNFLAYSQEVYNRKNRPDIPLIFVPKNHDPNFLKSGKLSEKSFYQRKSEWQHIIDSTWGPGDSLSRKLLIFNTYAKKVHDEFGGFLTLNLNYDSLYTLYLGKINASTSRGAFSAIMSRFAYDLRDAHTRAFDSTVVATPLNPGVPVLLLGAAISTEHFGAVTTVLPDSTTLVLRVVPNHPLHLEPGDIILGYEGVPWKVIVKELLDAGIPMLAATGGCNSAFIHHTLVGAGLNWHLFSTIDILKHSTGDTLHLPVLPLLNLDAPVGVNNEQLPVKNIPFPVIPPYPLLSDTVVTYGIVENTNIGYIYLVIEVPEFLADKQLFEAVKALKETDALIIDIRYNPGGYSTTYDSAFAILFNERFKTMQDAFRCNANTLTLCPAGNWNEYQIKGMPPDNYDRPIAVLLGPSCGSMGDLTALYFRYHPMARFFGKSAAGAMGLPVLLFQFPGWFLDISTGDALNTLEPEVYLNQKEFPVDFPVWHNADDVALGKDAVVEKALGWINNLAYAHDVTTDKWCYLAGKDSVIVNASIENPNSHPISAKLYFESLDGSVKDSAEMTEFISKGEVWQGKWKTPGPAENTYWISLKVTDNTNGTSFTSKHATQITTIPLLMDGLAYGVFFGSIYSFKPFLKNTGTTQAIRDITINMTCNDPWVSLIYPVKQTFPELLPGQVKESDGLFYVTYKQSIFPGYFNFKWNISSNGWPFWEMDTTLTITPYGIDEEEIIPQTYSLDQNYPNPFSESTSFSFNLPFQTFVSLIVFDLSGREVSTIVSEELPAGNHTRQWNAPQLPGGIYFYRIQAGAYTETKKLVLFKK